MDQKRDLFHIFESAIESVRPSVLFPRILAKPSIPGLADWVASENRYLLTLGKASISSAQSILAHYSCKDTFVLGPSNAETAARGLTGVYFGNHPVPDQRSLEAAGKLVSWLQTLPAGADLLIVLSGGTSALLALPPQGVSLESKMTVSKLLIRSGASIHEINSVRKHLSAVKGGQLAGAISGVRATALVISDVIGNDLSTIGSGPFYPDPSTFATAQSVLNKYGLWNQVPADIRRHIESGIAGRVAETLKKAPPVPHTIIASNELACGQAAETASALGYTAQVISGVSGPVETVAERILSLLEGNSPQSALILGGEATVHVRGNGTGGRNQHLALLLTERISGKNITFAAIGTDGIDGNSPAAGAWIDGRTAGDAAQQGLSIERALAEFDSFPFFSKLNHSIMTGPSGTNVMDLYIALT
jgi:glycerate-2-kinase